MQAMTRAAALAAGMIGAMSGASATPATAINLDAQDPAGVTLALEAGSYELRYIGRAEGGLYDSWNSWGFVSGCGTTPGDCAAGWVNFVGIEGASLPFTYRWDFMRYATPEAALDAAQGYFNPFTLTLASPATVRFFVPDFYYSDNTGGISLSLVPQIPEPGTVLLMAAGLGALALRGRRR